MDYLCTGHNTTLPITQSPTQLKPPFMSTLYRSVTQPHTEIIAVPQHSTQQPGSMFLELSGPVFSSLNPFSS